jgi:hypothetical protein
MEEQPQRDLTLAMSYPGHSFRCVDVINEWPKLTDEGGRQGSGKGTGARCDRQTAAGGKRELPYTQRAFSERGKSATAMSAPLGSAMASPGLSASGGGSPPTAIVGPKPPPAASSPLDRSQFDALHRMLSKSLAIIQGPPGTGKTVGVLPIIASVLHSELTSPSTSPSWPCA